MLTRLPLFALSFALVACGGDDIDTLAPEPVAAAEAEAPAAAPTVEAPPAFDGPALEITLQPVGDTMAFDATELTAAPGQTVRLTFENTAENPAMSHNVVFLYEGADVNAFGQAAMTAEDSEFIPTDMAEWAFAHTAVAAPGETVTVEFTAPAAGTYTYVCTFPGHYMLMTGTLIVAPAA